jgi:predicted small lipoprotein YifL
MEHSVFLHRQPRLAPVLLAAIFAAGLLLAGCGQKGPLFLPDDAKTQQQPESGE